MNQMNNTDGYRTELREIEDKIKSIAGPPDYTGYVRVLDELKPETLNTLESLLDDRRHCLNCLFRGTDGEIARFKKLNDRLSYLTDLMYRKTARMYRMLLSNGMDGEFDDDCGVEGELTFNYSSADSLLEFSGQEYYGSDFNYMINVIHEITYMNKALYPIAYSNKWYRAYEHPEMSDKELGLNNDTDEINWCEIRRLHPCCEWGWLKDIRLCYATHNLCVLKPYSVPDALLLNDFWCEVKVIYQHITDLHGINDVP